MTAGLRTIFRWLSRAVAALLLAVILLVLGVSAYLGTKHGRARLASAVVADLNRAIPGGVAVQELERFSLTEVVIRGMALRAPAGNDVLTIGRVRARLAPWSLLRGRFVVSELSLEDGVVDLRFGDAARRSLSSALIEPQAASAPRDGSRSSALVIEAARLERWRVRLPSGAGFPARELELASSSLRLEAGSELRLDVEPLQVRLLEHDREVGAFLVRGHLRSADVSRLALDGELLGMPIHLGVTMGEPAHPVSGWKNLPFAIELRASELTPARLRRLTAASRPLPPLAGPLEVQLSLRGVPEAFDAVGSVQTPAGLVTLHASAHDLARLQLAVHTDRLALRRLAASLPDWRVSSELALQAQREPERPARVRIESSLSTRVDDQPLPELTLRGERDSSAWQLELALKDRWVSLSAQGSGAGDGSGRGNARGWVSSREGLALVRALGLPRRWGLPPASDRMSAAGRLDASLDLVWSPSGNLDARGTLGARELELGTSRFAQLAVGLALAGPLDSPRLRVDGHWRAAPRGSDESTPGRLQLHGGPRRYRLHWSSGSLGFGSFTASGWLERESAARRFALAAKGHYRAAPWRVVIRDARLLDAGLLSLPRVELELCEQRFLLHGRYAGAGSGLVLELDDVDVGRLLQPFRETSELTGSLSGRLEARGDLKRPELLLSLRASRLGLRRRATLDARLDATLDARRGHFQVRAQARESVAASGKAKPRLDVTLDASGQVEALAPWPRAVRAGRQRARIEIAKLDSAVLEELVGAELPAAFGVHGSVDVDMRRGIPTLAYGVDGRVDWAVRGNAIASETDRSRSARLKHSFRYDAGRAETELSLSDAEGPWIELRGSVAPPGRHPASLAELVRRSKPAWMRELAAASWRVDLDAQRRSLDGLPVPPWLRRVSGAALAARLVAHRDRGAQPVGELTFDIAGAAQPAAPAAETASRSTRCSPSPLTTRGTLELDAGRFVADFTALDAGARKLHLSARGDADISAWLNGKRAAGWPRLDVDVDAAALPLERLPFVCDELRGELTAQGRVSDLFGRPEASGDVHLARFSLGSDQTVDVDARVELDAARLELSGKVLAAGRDSSFQIRMPSPHGSAAAGSAAPHEASFELSQLPLAPLIPRGGPVSHASGHVSGSLRASAGTGKPQLSGKLRLDGVGLTLTELAQPLSDINGELSLSDGALTLKRLSARDGEGELELSGTLQLASARDFDGRFQLVARKFPLRQSGEVVAQTTATARVDATWRPERNRLRVELENFDTWLERREPSRGMSLAAHPDLRVRPAPASSAQQEPGGSGAHSTRPERAPAAAPVPLSVEIDSAKQFWVKRADFAFKLSADLEIGIEPAAPGAERPSVSVKGQLRFDRGYMEMMGKTFEVKQGGFLRFTGGTSAALDLTAQYEDRRSSQRVVVHLQGSVAAPKLDFSVDGEKVSAGEAFQAIYGSSKTSRDDVEPEAQASQILGALMAGVLTTSIRRKLGSMAPILSVDPSDDDRGDQVRAGFELDALIPGFLRNIVTGVYVEGSVSSEKDNEQSGAKDVQTGVLIELYFPFNLVSSGRYGPDTTWSFDVGWQPRGGR